MDTTQIIILTMIVNIIMSSLVGGIVIYVIQKKIDATIQKSLFEHQIRFSRNYTKTLEVLETCRLKFNEFSRACQQLRKEFVMVIVSQETISEEEIKEIKNNLVEKNREFVVYFEDN